MPKFQKGRSGNAAGRTKGSLDRRSAWRSDMGAALPELITKLVALAKAGDLAAMSLILSRVCPPLRATSAPIDLPGLGAARTRSEAAQAVIEAVAEGRLSTDAASDLLEGLAAVATIVQVDDHAARLAAIEARDA